MQRIIVSKTGNGHFTSIQDAVDSIRVLSLEPVEILLKPGVYKEIIRIPDNKPHLKFIGENPETTIIENCRYARSKDENGNEIGTFKTAVMYIYADGFDMKNITVKNSAGYGDEIGQALALYVAADKCRFENVRLLGNQDTLYLSKGRQYFLNCYIEGHVDFIFGSGIAVFDYCAIHSLRKGYITAASTPDDQEFGFIFRHCKLTGASENTVFLGRPWRPHAHTAFLHTFMDSHIKPEGWDNWRDPDNEKTARYFEYKSEGPGAQLNQRVSWGKQLTDEEASRYTLQNIFRQEDDWHPNSAEK